MILIGQAAYDVTQEMPYAATFQDATRRNMPCAGTHFYSIFFSLNMGGGTGLVSGLRTGLLEYNYIV